MCTAAGTVLSRFARSAVRKSERILTLQATFDRSTVREIFRCMAAVAHQWTQRDWRPASFIEC
jgi:hypothetical protein